MKLEEAIERLSKFANIKILYGKHLLITTSQQHDIKEAINTVLQHVKHLQKENEELKEHNRKYLEAEIFSAKQIKEFEKQRNEHYIHKDKIKDCLEDIEDYFENVSVPKEDIEFIKEKRNDLLKEE